LDSLVRIETFQWVTRLLSGHNISHGFSVAFGAPDPELAALVCGRAGLSWGKLKFFSDFLQEIVVSQTFGRLKVLWSAAAISKRIFRKAVMNI
jgi:hypothetical protein